MIVCVHMCVCVSVSDLTSVSDYNCAVELWGCRLEKRKKKGVGKGIAEEDRGGGEGGTVVTWEPGRGKGMEEIYRSAGRFCVHHQRRPSPGDPSCLPVSEIDSTPSPSLPSPSRRAAFTQQPCAGETGCLCLLWGRCYGPSRQQHAELTRTTGAVSKGRSPRPSNALSCFRTAPVRTVMFSGRTGLKYKVQRDRHHQYTCPWL